MSSKSFLNLPKRSKNSKVNLKYLLPLCLCVSVVFFSCAKNSVNTEGARKLIAQQLNFPEKQIYIKTVSVTGNTALAEGGLKVAFVLQKDERGSWKLVKVRHASNRWENPEDFKQSLQLTSFGQAIESAFISQLEK
jgi:hypothetical protein